MYCLAVISVAFSSSAFMEEEMTLQAAFFKQESYSALAEAGHISFQNPMQEWVADQPTPTLG